MGSRATWGNNGRAALHITPTNVPEATSAYEAWVLELQAWAKDPSHDLSGLPQLHADSLPPSAYERLIGHIMAAQQEVMSTWQRRLERNIQSARSEHEYARALVELRALLGRRLQLASHPALPREIQDPLQEGVERDIRRIQQDLENAVTQPGRGGGIHMAARDRMLRLVRATASPPCYSPASRWNRYSSPRQSLRGGLLRPVVPRPHPPAPRLDQHA